MPTLYLLHEGHAALALDRRDIVAAGAARRGIGFVALDSLTCDYANLPRLEAGDMIFNCGRGSVRLETLLWRPGIGSFRTCGMDMFTNGSDSSVYCAKMAREGLSTPRTIHRLPPENQALASAVEYLGGFPLIIKATGGTMGVGVMLIESMRSLRSVADYLRATGGEFMLRQYIEPQHVARLVVLGEKVIASLKYAIHPDDFRGLPYRLGGQAMAFGVEAEALAIAAAKASYYDFTGVDILIDRQGRAYVLEANPPSNFVSLEHDLGIPVGDMVVEYLMEKASLAQAAA